MSARAKTREPSWEPPRDQELAVLRRQIEQAIVDGEEIAASRPYADGWGAWQTNLGHLVTLACGPESPQAISYRDARGFFANDPDERDMSPSAYADAMVEWRNDTIARYISAARGALKAIDQEMERRGVRTTEGSGTLPAETFAFVSSAPIRAIALRDYEELRIAARTVKARALLAGSVVEAVLFDALEQKGVAAPQVAKMSFHDLIQQARTLQVITARTAKVADSLRDMRNLVHPAVELREGELRGADADAAVSLMALVLEELR